MIRFADEVESEHRAIPAVRPRDKVKRFVGRIVFEYAGSCGPRNLQLMFAEASSSMWGLMKASNFLCAPWKDCLVFTRGCSGNGAL